MATTGDKLKYIREKEKGWTRAEAERRTGVPARTLIHIERNERSGYFETILKLVYGYGKELNDVAPDDEELQKMGIVKG